MEGLKKSSKKQIIKKYINIWDKYNMILSKIGFYPIKSSNEKNSHYYNQIIIKPIFIKRAFIL